MSEVGLKTTITILNHPTLGTAPLGYVLFAVNRGDPDRPSDEWQVFTTERNPYTVGGFRFPETFVGAEPARLARILDAIDRALTAVADDPRPQCVTVGCSTTAVMEVFWPGKTVAMCELCTWRAIKLAEAMGFQMETRPLSEKR